MPAIDGDRLLKDLYAVREIGKFKTRLRRVKIAGASQGV